MQKSQRLLSLDALRGFDMFFIMGFDRLIIAVCALLPYSWASSLSAQMTHPSWDGFSFYDTIFPLFLFLAGTSFPFSLASQRKRHLSKSKIYGKILLRTAILILLGLLYNGLLEMNFSELRIPSVLGRIGLAWGIAAIIYVMSTARARVVLSLLLLVGYGLLISLVPAGDLVGEFSTPLTIENNIVGYIDSIVMPNHLLYAGVFDPEGLLSTIPAVATALLGMLSGDIVRSTRNSPTAKALILAAIGAGLLAVGFAIEPIMQVNKSLWTPSFACFAGGYSFLIFALFYFVIDVLKWQRWSFFFRVIGMNSILIYMGQRFINFSFSIGIGILSPEVARITYLVVYIALSWLVLRYCYKTNFFLKV